MLDGIPLAADTLERVRHFKGKGGARDPETRNLPTIQQILRMQRVAMADACNMSLTARERAYSMLAWDKLEERKRIHRGKALPGSYRPVRESKPAARRPRALPDPAPTERAPVALDCQTDYGTNGQTSEPTPQA